MPEHNIVDNSTVLKITEPAALPAGYFLKHGVQAAIRAEIVNDILEGKPVPPGVEVLDAKALNLSDSEEPKTDGATGQESKGSSQENESQASRSSKGNTGRANKSTSSNGNRSSKAGASKGKKSK